MHNIKKLESDPDLAIQVQVTAEKLIHLLFVDVKFCQTIVMLDHLCHTFYVVCNLKVVINVVFDNHRQIYFVDST